MDHSLLQCGAIFVFRVHGVEKHLGLTQVWVQDVLCLPLEIDWGGDPTPCSHQWSQRSREGPRDERGGASGGGCVWPTEGLATWAAAGPSAYHLQPRYPDDLHSARLAEAQPFAGGGPSLSSERSERQVQWPTHGGKFQQGDTGAVGVRNMKAVGERGPADSPGRPDPCWPGGPVQRAVC